MAIPTGHNLHRFRSRRIFSTIRTVGWIFIRRAKEIIRRRKSVYVIYLAALAEIGYRPIERSKHWRNFVIFGGGCGVP
jgi:hypothetical protein